MRLTFRQGIARYQTDVYATPSFLQKNDDYVDLIVSPDPTIVVFAHKAATYVIEENKTVQRAWGPFNGNATRYLYWDINLLDGSLTRGFTLLTPIVSATEPNNPSNDQHWYDKTNHQMKVWIGGRWADRVRVFAATYSNKIVPYPLGSQAGENGDFVGGTLVRDEYSKPLRQSDGTFVTTATNLSIANTNVNTVSLEAKTVIGMAKENIPKFSFVGIDQNKLKLARSDNWRSRVIGLVTEDLYISEVGNVETTGLIRNEQWNWPMESMGRPVFCGVTGEITLTPPSHGVLQIVGYVYDKNSIVLQIHPVTILDDIRTNIIDLPPPGPVGTSPIADFTMTPDTGTAPLTVQFKDTSLHAPTTLEWDFTGDGTIDSRQAETSYIFSQAGTYTVKLKATNEYGTTTKTKTISIAAPAVTGVKTNLEIQLSGPLQINASQEFQVQVTVSNVSLQTATNVKRVITIDDVNDEHVKLTAVPTNSTVAYVGNTTVIGLPTLSTLGTNQTVTLTFSISAPKKAGLINIRAGVASLEADSSPSDNITALSIRVK